MSAVSKGRKWPSYQHFAIRPKQLSIFQLQFQLEKL